MPSAIDISSVVGLAAVGILTGNILLGLLISTGYNPLRRWPRPRQAVQAAQLDRLHRARRGGAPSEHHPVLVHSRVRRIRHPGADCIAVQPFENTLGAIALYLVAFAVITSYFRHVFGFHRWKQLHYATYAAACVFYVHGILADPLLQNRPVDWIDAEKASVEGCALLVVGATVWRYRYARRRQLARADAHFTNM